MIEVRCECRRELSAPGALVFGSPSYNTGLVTKKHVCLRCERLLHRFLAQLADVGDCALCGGSGTIQTGSGSTAGIPHCPNCKGLGVDLPPGILDWLRGIR